MQCLNWFLNLRGGSKANFFGGSDLSFGHPGAPNNKGNYW